MNKQDIQLQAEALCQYLNKFNACERAQEAQRWFLSKDFQSQDQVEILLYFVFDMGQSFNE